MDGKEGFFKQLGEGINQLMETSSVGLNEVVRVLGALAQGRPDREDHQRVQGTFGQLKDDSNMTVEKLTEIVSQIKEATESINMASKEIASGNTDLSQPHRRAGLEPGGDGLQHGRADQHGEAERGEREAGEPAGGRGLRRGGQGRQRGGPGGDDDELDQRESRRRSWTSSA